MGHVSFNRKEYRLKYLSNLNQHSVDSITTGEIIDRRKWDLKCNMLRSGAPKYPYSEDFTNDIIFDMMVKGCFYCGELATTIDRVDSNIGHTPANCVGCCHGCNMSKGVADPSTFIRKAYYRVRGEYIDEDTDIWIVKKQKPRLDQYKKSAEKKGVSFELTKEDFDGLIKGECAYCKRTPSTWFGIDRVVPSQGYVLGNVVTCCYDCNLDKHESDVDITTKRNELIANRMDDGDLIVKKCDKVILHQGTQKSSKKVCAFGIVYSSKSEASRSLGKGYNYVSQCITLGIHSNDIFEIYDN